MKNLKKVSFLLLFICLLTCILPFSVSANGPSIQDHLTVCITSIPENAVYADLLIVFDEGDPNYVEFQPSAYGDDPTALKEITEYAEDGYQSFTIHYKNAKSIVKLSNSTAWGGTSEGYRADFCAVPMKPGDWMLEFDDQYNDLRKNYRNVKIALLDKDYKILSVSKAVQLPKISLFHSFDGVMDYDAEVDAFRFYTWYNAWAWIGIIFSVFLMFISIGTECLVALIFGLKGKKLLTILIVNLCTQIVMRLLHIVLPLNYWLEVAVLETLVYTAEFFLYKKYLKDISTGKLLFYTILANTVSLFFGLRLNQGLFG